MKLALLAIGVALGAWPSIGYAADPPQEPQYDEDALKSVLDEAPGTVKKNEKAGSALEVPPPPPRKTGVVVEGSVGAMGFLGKLNTVSPAASNFHVQAGVEPLRWILVFGEGDVSFTSTRYSPPARGYSIYAFGGGARATVGVSDRWSIYGQMDLGLTATSDNVLHSYGFVRAENLNLYVGGTAGLEWYQPDPHYALALYVGMRSAQSFERSVASDNGLAWRGGVSIRYAF